MATETKVEETNQPAPCYNKSFVSCCGGLKISAKIEQLPDHYPCPVPKWSALTFDADKKIKGRSVAADLIRLFATPKFWTAASTGNQEAIDEQARKLVPIIPFWDQPTWRRVAKMEPEQQYAVAVWISENCGRQPKVGTLNRINDLNVLVEAWINFDKHSRWIDPTLASASQVTDFVRTVDKFLRSDESKMQMDHLYKRIARKGANVTLTRTKQVIEGSVIWKKGDDLQQINLIAFSSTSWVGITSGSNQTTQTVRIVSSNLPGKAFNWPRQKKRSRSQSRSSQSTSPPSGGLFYTLNDHESEKIKNWL